jgi:short-subunit dehydrogenase
MAGLTEYKNRVAVVAGASSGIGAELARQLARKGMRVALVARRAERLDKVAAEIGRVGGSASVYPCDVADRASVESCGRAVREAFGRIDLLVNCAGYARHVLFKDHDTEDIQAMMQTNYMGTVHWIKQALPVMREQGAGWIVNFSSFAGLVAQPDEAAYTATKFALTGLSDALVWEFRPLGIHVMCVYPVLVETEMFTAGILERMPPGAGKRFMRPERFVAETLKALERGDHHAVIPRGYRWVGVLKALFPGLLGRKIGAVRLGALPDVLDRDPGPKVGPG